MRTWLISLLAVFAVVPSFSQKGDTRPRFEVAAVRECVGTQPRGLAIHVSPGRLSVPCFGLLRLIQDAYQIFGDGTANFMYQPPAGAPIEGFPNEMSPLRYSIDAKSESPQGVGIMRGPMMQRLLEDRFHLKIRREIREVPVYIMTVAKDGPKLQATTEDSCNRADLPDFNQPLPSMPGGKPACAVLVPPAKNGAHFVLAERGIGIGAFAKLLRIGGLPVIDRTGLTKVVLLEKCNYRTSRVEELLQRNAVRIAELAAAGSDHSRHLDGSPVLAFCGHSGGIPISRALQWQTVGFGEVPPAVSFRTISVTVSPFFVPHTLIWRARSWDAHAVRHSLPNATAYNNQREYAEHCRSRPAE